MRQFWFSVFLVVSIFTQGHSQIILYAQSSKAEDKLVAFRLNSVTDSLNSKKIGLAYLADEKTRTSVILEKPAAQYVKQLFETHFIADKNRSDSVNIILDHIILTETKIGKIIEGKISVKLTYTAQQNQQLLTKETTSAYRRTFGSATPKVFQQVLTNAFVSNVTYFDLWLNQNLTFHPAFVTKSEIVIQPAYLTNTTDTVYYGSRPITWADFAGKPVNPGNRFAAAIFPNIAFDLEMKVSNRTLTAYFTPKVYMVQGMSWVKSYNTTDYALEHEQLHFDIAKIAMNRLVRRLPEIEATNPDDLQSQIQYAYIEAYREMNRLQEAYDKETGHGVDQIRQAFWKTQLSEWLNE